MDEGVDPAQHCWNPRFIQDEGLFDMAYRRTYLFALVTFVFVLASRMSQGSDGLSSADPSENLLAEFDVAKEGDVLLLPVVFGDRKALFLLDSGSATNVLDSTLAASLSPLSRSNKRYPNGLPELYQFPDAHLEGTSIPVSDDAAIVDLSELRRMSGYSIQGILGISFLRRFVLDIDFDKGRVRILSLDTQPLANSIRITRDPYQRPVIVVELTNGGGTPFLVDTGMALPGVGEFKARTFHEMLSEDRLRLLDNASQVVTVAGVVAGRKAVLDTFPLGPYEHKNLRVTSGSINAIGLRLLSRYHVRFDFSNERGWFEPGHRFNARPLFDASGLTICRDGEKTIVLRVAKSSPAELSGFTEGDVLLQFNQVALANQSLFNIRKVLCRDGTTLQVTRIREGNKGTVPLELSDWQGRDAESRTK